MVAWSHIEEDVPEFAAAVLRSFAAGKHKVMATLRADGSPRVSGTELDERGGDLWLGSMPGARKAQDLRRDNRVAIHSPTIDEEMKLGDAKISGRAIEVTDPAVMARFVTESAADHGFEPPQPFHLFKLDVQAIARTTVEGETLVIESWHAGRGYERIERR